MYRLSKYVQLPRKKEMWIHPYTRQGIGFSDKIEKIFPDVLKQCPFSEGINPRDKFLQLVALELAHRGFIVPTHIPQDQEETYFDQISPMHSIKRGFLDIPTSHYYMLPDDTRLAILGIPCDLGSHHPGSRFGPSLIREQSFSHTFRGGAKSIHKINTSPLVTGQMIRAKAFDLGNIAFNDRPLSYWLERTEEIITSLPSSIIPITIGGSHTFTLPIIRGMYRKLKCPLHLVQIDSHLDLQVWGTYTEDQPLQLAPPTHGNFISHIAQILPDLSITQLGISAYQTISPDLHPQVTAYLKKIGTQISDETLMSDTFSFESLQVATPIYLSIDVDVLSATEMPHTGYPAPTGIPFSYLRKLVHYITQHNTVIGVDIMEFGRSEIHHVHRYSAGMLTQLILDILGSVG